MITYNVLVHTESVVFEKKYTLTQNLYIHVCEFIGDSGELHEL